MNNAVAFLDNLVVRISIRIVSSIRKQNLKMLCLYLLGQNCLHLTFKPYLNSKTYSRKYEILPNIVVHACKILQKKMYLLKMSGPPVWLCLFTFRPIASKQLNGLTTINTLIWLAGAVVTHPLWVQGIPGSSPAPARVFMFDFCFYFFCPKTHYL